MKRIITFNQLGSLLKIILIFVFFFTGCSNLQGEINFYTEEYTYVPEYVVIHTLEPDVDMVYSEVFLGHNFLYYNAGDKTTNGSINILNYERNLLGEGQSVMCRLQFPKSQIKTISIFKDHEGNYCTIEADREAGNKEEEGYMYGYCFSKYDEDGYMILRLDITELLERDILGRKSVRKAVTDLDGNIYIQGERAILLLDSEGKYHETIIDSMGICDISRDKDGNVYYIVRYENELKEVDFENAQSQLINNKFVTKAGMCWDADGSLVTYDNDGIYLFDKNTNKQEMILNWVDINIVGSEVLGLTTMEDGRIVAVRGEPLGDISINYELLELIYLTKTEGQLVSQKEIITIGVMDVTDSMRKAAVSFNKSNDKYSIRIKEYLNEYTEQGYEEAIMAMDLDLVSGNMPDIIDIGYADIHKYFSKGLLEDLNPYLEKSESFRKEDLVEAVVDAYTFDNKLVCLPTVFRLQVIMGSASKLGSKSGWTLDEMIVFFDKYGDEQVYDSVSKEGILDLCLSFYQSAVVDMQGEDFLHLEELKKILEFSKRFTGENGDWNYINRKDGSALLMNICFANPEMISEMPQHFEEEEVTYIGYPTIDGSPGILLDTSKSAFGIMKDSPHKDAAWEFLEYLILEESEKNNLTSVQFSILKDSLEQRLAEAEVEPYELDNDGNIMYDEEGNPVRRIIKTVHYVNSGIETYVYALLPEESEKIRELIRIARPATGNQKMVADIIKEEASAYYSGQKSVEEVIGIIQNRIKTYIDENKNR